MILIEETYDKTEDSSILINSNLLKKNSKKNKECNSVNKLETEKKRLLSIFDSITELQEIQDEDEIRALGSAIISSLNSCFASMTNIMQTIVSDDALSLLVQKDDLPVLEFNKTGNILKITFPTLLPRRINYGEKQYSIELKRISMLYGKAFYDYFQANPYRYDRRVVLCFINHFSGTRTMKDHDNFDIKLIIDYIANGILPDDSPNYCSHYMDYVIDNVDFSEIFVVPEDEFIGFLQELNIKKKGV